jgi:hypothetical protein
MRLSAGASLQLVPLKLTPSALSDILVRNPSAGDFLIPALQVTRTKKSAADLVPDKDVRNSKGFLWC